MMENVTRAARAIREHSQSVRALCQKTRDQPPVIERQDVLEPKLLHKIANARFNGTVCGVDGGLAAQSLAGADIVITRASGVSFTYNNSSLTKSAQLPQEPLSVFVEHSLDSSELSYLKAISRLTQEVSCALKCLEKFKPDVLMLDGSIVPQVSDKPPKENALSEQYEKLVALYCELFDKSASSETTLVGVIKDSRGKRFLQLLEESGHLDAGENALLEKSNDTVFLDSLLRHGERTFAFKYTHAASQHSVLRDFSRHNENIATTYLRPASLDRPLRIDFLSSKHNSIDGVASMVQSLCSANATHAHPAVLIEADLRAAIRPEEVDHVSQALASSAGFNSALLSLRRDSRPFR
ncbi:MAG TPA: DNA double-strand break repair nuclease NurA [Candidatus Norongarragalinales archaeon]|jgi:hypothetical protein|nr:DNA double-strand break repair nuclease NurA [Candidatus Norongarragalinales archaeon]